MGARVRRLLSKPYLVGALALVFVLLLAGIVLAGQGQVDTTGTTAQAVDVGALPSPTATAVVIRSASSPTPVSQRTVPGATNASGAANASGNVSPHETVLVVKTLDRYIQNAGGDPGSQLRTPAVPATPAPPSPVPTSASGPLGALSWTGEGTYVTEPFSLNAGTISVQVNAGVLTMVQLRNAAGTAIGIATAGSQPSNTTMQVPATGTYRVEVWPFGAGPWTVTISYASSPTTAPTLAPVTATTAAPAENVTTELPTTVVPTMTEIPTLATTEVPTTVPTEVPTPTPTQERRNFIGSGTMVVPQPPATGFPLNEGLAIIGYMSPAPGDTTPANGTFKVTLINPDGTVAASIVDVVGPTEGSLAVSVPATAQYRFNVVSTGSWKVSID